jgi:DNA (cytosine-5)-methyltransferase 1
LLSTNRRPPADGYVENDAPACNTLRLNRPKWKVFEQDLTQFDAKPFAGVDLVAGGLPCPPFSVAGKQLGELDERNLFPAGLRIVAEVMPKAVMFENVRGMLDPSFTPYRDLIERKLRQLGYVSKWKLLNASDFGVPQLRPRVVLAALRSEYAGNFEWPSPLAPAATVGEALVDLMAQRGWRGAKTWAAAANKIAPTIVGGSKKHGGPDLGPTRARKAWEALGVNGKSIAEQAPDKEFDGMPRLTVRMVARLQGFPDEWGIWGAKTAAYRQVGNAFPPPVAAAVATALLAAIQVRSPRSKVRAVA